VAEVLVGAAIVLRSYTLEHSAPTAG